MQSFVASSLTVGLILSFSGWKWSKMPQEEKCPVEEMPVRQRLFENVCMNGEESLWNQTQNLKQEPEALIRTKWESQEETSNLNVEQEAELVPPSEPVPTQAAPIPLGTHFLFPLFSYVGADVAALLPEFSVKSLIHSLFGLMSFCLILKLKREKRNLEKKVSQLQTALQEKNIHHNDAERKWQGVETESDPEGGPGGAALQRVQDVLQREEDSLKPQLRAVGENIQSNREQLQEVEEQIWERETELDKPAELLRQKEELLRAQWGLDAEKNHLEKQLLLLEKLQEAAELQ
ncbi:uncharacterized protein ACNS7B_021180 [Menidia menidia]